jgi:hypothetical protein
MKLLIRSVCTLMALASISVYQSIPLYGQSTFSATVQQLQRTGVPGSEIVFDVAVRNNSASEITLSFVRRGSTLPSGWESALCVGNACFPSSIDSIALSPAFGMTPLAPGDSCPFSLHVYTTAQTGSGTVRVLIRSGRGDADTLGLQFSASTSSSAVSNNDAEAVPGIILSSYPNPFNPSTTLTWSMDHTANVTVSVFDLLGRWVSTPVHGVLPPGMHRVVFDASGDASGVYIARLMAGNAIRSHLMVRAK